jgi:uncharacterized protein
MTKIRDGATQIPDLSSLPPDGGPEFNRLVFTSSPYLLQHARNPVDWYPWSGEAFEKAKNEDKPVFLSVGYSTCHWCHVMEHESFEDAEVAAFLNEHFVSIKVDREERPDVDHIYMAVCQAMTGSGGWPMTIFMTPGKQPFFAGTYFPKEDRFGRPGFLRVLQALQHVWQNERHKALETAAEIVGHLLQSEARQASDLSADVMDQAVAQCLQTYDERHGGFGSAPKFPMPHLLSFLMRRQERTGDVALRDMMEKTLMGMYRGGIFDHIGFGFCRYSTDDRWLVPHFEKMLYDNALLLIAYVDAWLLTKKPEYERISREIITYVNRDMTDAAGGFYSAENADCEGIEGKFYVFTKAEFLQIVDADDGPLLAEYFGISDAGNFEHGANILHIAVESSEWRRSHGLSEEKAGEMLSAARERLFAYREARVHPSLDDKILTSWNGLMIAALARAGQAFGDPVITRMARDAAEFVLSALATPDGTLLHRFRKGEAGIPGFLEDYAFFIWGLLELYEATFDSRYLREAVRLNSVMLRDFLDREHGGLFLTAHAADEILVRSKDVHDGALPSGNSVAACNLLRLARMTGDDSMEDAARGIFRTFASQVQRYPTGHAMLLTALDFAVGPTKEIVLSGNNVSDVVDFSTVLRSRFLPRKVVLFHPPGSEGGAVRTLSAFLEGLLPVDGAPAAYLCEDYRCALPATSVAAVERQLANAPAHR